MRATGRWPGSAGAAGVTKATGAARLWRSGPPAYRYPAYSYPAYRHPGGDRQLGYGYSGYSRAPGYAGPPAYEYHGGFGQPAYPARRAMGFQATWVPPPTQVMGRRATLAPRLTPIPRGINRRTMRDALVTPVHPANGLPSQEGRLAYPGSPGCGLQSDEGHLGFTPVRRAMDTKAPRLRSRPHFRSRTSRLWLSQQSRFRGLVSWDRARDRAC